MNLKYNLLNQKFGKLTVLKLIDGPKDKKGYNRKWWLCQCICGKEILALTSSLIHKDRTSCGCGKIEANRNNLHKRKNFLPKKEAAVRAYYREYVRGAKRRNITFNINPLDFTTYIFDNCYYCGSSPNKLHPPVGQKNRPNGDILVNGIDRKNSQFGYEKNNVVTCCKICNYAKNKLSYQEFITWIKKLKEYSI